MDKLFVGQLIINRHSSALYKVKRLSRLTCELEVLKSKYTRTGKVINAPLFIVQKEMFPVRIGDNT